jgi:alkanesulfonate monooxygenase SsuD/methylene tetrahydromethanopterin reductase-like flavin-dependent oxidoreductase (luciferase family)
MYKRTETGAFDFEGQYFQIQGAYAEPKPVLKPYPLIMNAASNLNRGFKWKCRLTCRYNDSR